MEEISEKYLWQKLCARIAWHKNRETLKFIKRCMNLKVFDWWTTYSVFWHSCVPFAYFIGKRWVWGDNKMSACQWLLDCIKRDFKSMYLYYTIYIESMLCIFSYFCVEIIYAHISMYIWFDIILYITMTPFVHFSISVILCLLICKNGFMS